MSRRCHTELGRDEHRAGSVIEGRAGNRTKVAARRQQVVPAAEDQQVGLLRSVEHRLDRGRVLHADRHRDVGELGPQRCQDRLELFVAAGGELVAVRGVDDHDVEAGREPPGVQHHEAGTPGARLLERGTEQRRRLDGVLDGGGHDRRRPPTRGAQPSGTETTGTWERPATLWAIDPVKTRRTLLIARCWSTRTRRRSVCRTRSSTTQPLSISSAVTGTSSPASSSAFVWASVQGGLGGVEHAAVHPDVGLAGLDREHVDQVQRTLRASGLGDREGQRGVGAVGADSDDDRVGGRVHVCFLSSRGFGHHSDGGARSFQHGQGARRVQEPGPPVAVARPTTTSSASGVWSARHSSTSPRRQLLGDRRRRGTSRPARRRTRPAAAAGRPGHRPRRPGRHPGRASPQSTSQKQCMTVSGEPAQRCLRERELEDRLRGMGPVGADDHPAASRRARALAAGRRRPGSARAWRRRH